MLYLLDTDTVIFVLRGLKARRGSMPGVRRRLAVVERCREAQRAGDLVGLSTITVSELEYRARGSQDYEREMAAVRKILTPFEILDYDDAASVHYGIVRSALEDAGTPIGAMDLLIAAHALATRATLVTNNTSHFGRIPGLPLSNWIK